MKNLTIAILLLLCVYSCNKEDQLLVEVNGISKRVEAKYSPDQREAIFQTSFSFENNKLIVRGETSELLAKQTLYSELEKLDVTIIDSLELLPEKKLKEKNWGLVNLSVVNLRANPKHSAELVSQAIMGTPVKVLKQEKSWFLIQTPDKYIAWVDAAAIALKAEGEMEAWRTASRVIFTPDFEVAKDPEQTKVITDLVAGSILEIEKENQDTYNLILPDERKIQIKKTDCKIFADWKNREVKDVAVLTKTAKQFIGRPYLWGGTSAKGVDCSGFVKSVYFMNGIILARDASLQFLHGETISPEQGFLKLEEGDLVFFGRAKTDERSMKVTHVGMYMNNGEYIHSSGRVRINSFEPDAENYNNYRSVTWLGGRRILSEIGEPGICRVSEHLWY